MTYTLQKGVFIVRTYLFVSSHHLTHTEYRKTFARRNVPTKSMWPIAQYIRFVLYDHPVSGEQYCTVRMPNFLPSSVSPLYVRMFSLTVFFFFSHVLNVSGFRRVRDQVLHASKHKRCTISILILYFYKDETKIVENVQMSSVFNSAVCKSCEWVSMYACIMHVTIHIRTRIHNIHKYKNSYLSHHRTSNALHRTLCRKFCII